MIDRIRSASNPLTIIAIFAALAEVAGTVALATVNPELQHVFVWFVMAFPTVLVTAFFLTLNFNPKVLYAPRDFRNEDNFLNTLRGTRTASRELDTLVTRLATAKEEITTRALQELRLVGESDRGKLAAVVNRELEPIELDANSARRHVGAILQRVTGDIRSWPHEKPCPKCGATMRLNHDTGEYACERCSHWE